MWRTCGYHTVRGGTVIAQRSSPNHHATFMHSLAALLLVLLPQQDLGRTGFTSPPNGDTVGYWQQRVAYTIVATLDEPGQRIRARGTLRYVNNSPDTLREMFVQQYLNAFRPASAWSQADEREGRERFQHLSEPQFGYERFTAPVRVDGTPVVVDYPGAPDSTVAHFRLPAPLAPGDSALVQFEWDARPSTVPRRQGRRGRHWDLSQWFPKVAVYDRGGWQPNALRPAGEFYGEFGTYDVTLVVPEDQVIGATGVPVSGDPGWSRVIRGGSARLARDAYRSLPPAPHVSVPAGFKAVRFFARDVHSFAWTASPDYRYDGGAYVRQRTVHGAHLPVWDTVSVHVLWRAGDDTTWGGLRAVRRTIAALQWLESYYGPYPHPQLSTNHRLDGGGSELPMFLMNGSASQGLILHEGGHMFEFGVLANNEWRSGWMDEGGTSYQTAWAQGLTPQERVRSIAADRPRLVTGYRALGLRMELPRFEVVALGQATADLVGESQPMGTVAHEFRDFNTYNDMIYDRSEVMHGQLRDLLGDSIFVAFYHGYYDRWALKHVDERAMRASAQRASGRNLDWFFDQWVHRTGVMDYQLGRVRTARDSSGMWVTEATVRRRGAYRHPMIVGVRTGRGWTLGRMSREPYDEEVVRVVTRDEPFEVRLDPHHFTWDWDRRNDRHGWPIRYVFDWPFLDQVDRERAVSRLSPVGWYSEPGGVVLGGRERSSYLGLVDKFEGGIGFVVDPREPMTDRERIPVWFRFENPTFRGGPVMGLGGSGAFVDALEFARLNYGRERSTARQSFAYDVGLTWSRVANVAQMPEQWSDVATVDVGVRTRVQRGLRGRGYGFVEASALGGVAGSRGYGKGELAAGAIRIRERSRLGVRLYAGGTTDEVPAQRALYVSSADPLRTFFNHWWRPQGALLKRPGMNWLPLGGAALRGFGWDVAAQGLGGGNVEGGFRIAAIPIDGEPGLWLNVFGDLAYGQQNRTLSDAGIGIALRGRIYDRDITVRLDAPFFVSRPALGIERDDVARDQLAARWVLSFNDIW
jgi:peptidase M1-like protein